MNRYRFEAYVSRGLTHDGYWTDDPTEFAALYLGYLTPDKEGRFYDLEYCGGSDYLGDAVTRSNYEVVLAEMKERGVLEKGVWPYYGGHGTYGIVFAPDLLDEETMARIDEIDAALSDYPVLDEEKWSQIEHEAEDEAWESWLDYDVTRHLVKLLEVDDLEEFDEDLPDNLRSFFEFCMDKQNEYYINEQGNSAWVNIERVLPDKATVLGHWLKWKEQEVKYER